MGKAITMKQIGENKSADDMQIRNNRYYATPGLDGTKTTKTTKTDASKTVDVSQKKTSPNYMTGGFMGNSNDMVNALARNGINTINNGQISAPKIAGDSATTIADADTPGASDAGVGAGAGAGSGKYYGTVADFKPSETYMKALEYTNSLLNQLSAGRTSYTDKLNDIMAQINGREQFTYDFNTDPLFQQNLQSAMASGQLAMQDTMGQAAALTGGYGSTYSQAVGNQAYNSSIQQAYDALPEFYGLAKDAYDTETQNLLNRLSMYQTADDTEYSRLANAYSVNAQNAANIYDQEYNNYWQTQNFNESSRQWADEMNANEEQAYAKLLNDAGITIDSSGKVVATADTSTQYKEPSSTQYANALKYYDMSPTEFNKYLDSLPENIDVEKIMDYVTQHGKLGLAYKEYTNVKDTKNWFGGIDNNDVVRDTDGKEWKLKDLYKELIKAGMSEEDAKAYILQFNGEK